MEVYKYNAFSDMGGETSFVIALLDHNNNGTHFKWNEQSECNLCLCKRKLENGASKDSIIK